MLSQEIVMQEARFVVKGIYWLESKIKIRR